MKLHLNICSAPCNMYSCASRIISMVTGENDVDVARRVARKRSIKSHDELMWMWDHEIRFELRKWLRKTRCIYPQRKTTVLELSRQVHGKEWVLVMVPEHVLIIHGGKLYDVNNHGNPIQCCSMWCDATIEWYQRMRK